MEPWEGGIWRLRDIIDYQLIALESCLYQAATRRADLLRNFYEVGRRSVARPSPYAFVIPRAQLDPGSARKMLELLSFGEVEIERARAPFDPAGPHYPDATYVHRTHQPHPRHPHTPPPPPHLP